MVVTDRSRSTWSATGVATSECKESAARTGHWLVLHAVCVSPPSGCTSAHRQLLRGRKLPVLAFRAVPAFSVPTLSMYSAALPPSVAPSSTMLPPACRGANHQRTHARHTGMFTPGRKARSATSAHVLAQCTLLGARRGQGVHRRCHVERVRHSSRGGHHRSRAHVRCVRHREHGQAGRG